MILQAHAGHWLIDVAYFLPVAGFMVWLGWTTIRDRRRRHGEEADSDASAG